MREFPKRRILTRNEVAAMLGVCGDTLTKMLRTTDIPHQRVERKLIFDRDAVLAWLGRR